MKKLLCVAAASLACAAAGAQTANFEGVSAALNLNLLGTSVKTTNFFGDGETFDGLGKNATGASAQLSYGFALSKDTVLTLGGTYALNSPKIMDISGDGGSITGKFKNMASLYLEPGYLLSDKTMVYGKLSYETAKLTASGENGGASRNINGTGFGAGLRTMLDKNMFLQVEVKKVGYGSKSLGDTDPVEFKTSATVGTVGIGWKF